MPISYTVDPSRGRVLTIVQGKLTGDEILSHLEDVLYDQSLRLPELIDLRQVAPPFMTADEIRRVAEAVHETLGYEPHAPRALVASSDVVFGLARMFATLMSDVLPMRVFRDEASAEMWLSRP
jgi:hypothetical protein